MLNTGLCWTKRSATKRKKLWEPWGSGTFLQWKPHGPWFQFCVVLLQVEHSGPVSEAPSGNYPPRWWWWRRHLPWPFTDWEDRETRTRTSRKWLDLSESCILTGDEENQLYLQERRSKFNCGPVMTHFLSGLIWTSTKPEIQQRPQTWSRPKTLGLESDDDDDDDEVKMLIKYFWSEALSLIHHYWSFFYPKSNLNRTNSFNINQSNVVL